MRANLGSALVVGGACLIAGTVASSARAAESASDAERRSELAFVTGTLSAIVPFAVGGVMIASGPRDPSATRHAGVVVAGLGLTAGPLVAHAMVSEVGRGLAFSAVPFVCGVGLAVLQELPKGDVLEVQGTRTSRIPWGIFTAVALASSAVGIFDVLMHERRVAIDVWPGLSGTYGLSIGGLL